MSHDHIWLAWRGFNEVLAGLAIFLHLIGWDRRSKAARSTDMGFLANVAWSTGYLIATITASLLPGGSPGPWTAIMTIPIAWTVAAGIFLVRGDHGRP